MHYLEVQDLKNLEESLPVNALTVEDRQTLKQILKPRS
jgi:hypothetical protein